MQSTGELDLPPNAVFWEKAILIFVKEKKIVPLRFYIFNER